MTDFIKNDDGSFMSESQIVNHMISILNDDSTKKILASNFNYDPYETEESQEISLKTGFHPKVYYQSQFSRQLRNTFGLWSKDNPNVVLNPEPNTQGIIDHPLFPDNMSGRIIDELVNFYKKESERV